MLAPHTTQAHVHNPTGLILVTPTVIREKKSPEQSLEERRRQWLHKVLRGKTRYRAEICKSPYELTSPKSVYTDTFSEARDLLLELFEVGYLSPLGGIILGRTIIYIRVWDGTRLQYLINENNTDPQSLEVISNLIGRGLIKVRDAKVVNIESFQIQP